MLNINVLTERQTQLILLVKSGLSNAEIAKKLKVSEATVNVTLHNAYKRLGIVLKRKKRKTKANGKLVRKKRRVV